MAWAKDRQVVRYQRVIEPELSACLDLGWRSGLWGIGRGAAWVCPFGQETCVALGQGACRKRTERVLGGPVGVLPKYIDHESRIEPKGLGRQFLQDDRCCLLLAVLVQEERQMLRLGKRAKRNETTAPDRIRKWSPTLLLTGRYPGYLRRSDGMRSFLGSMAVDKV